MTHNLQAKLERDADRKGLHGAAKQAYIGGAWQRITHGEQRQQWWRNHEDYPALSALVGTVDELRFPKARPDAVVFRQRGQWYELDIDAYNGLVAEGRGLLAEQEKAAKEEEKRRKAEEEAIAAFHRAEEIDKRRDAVRAARAERQEAAAREAEEKAVRAVERAEYRDVLAILRDRGGVRASDAERSEFRDYIPKHVRAKAAPDAGRPVGLLPDDAAREISIHMPWLKIDRPDDLYQYFERHEDRRHTLAAGRKPKFDPKTAKPAEVTPPPEPEPEPETPAEELAEELTGPPAPPPTPEAAVTPPPVEQAASWLQVFGEAQPLPKPDEATGLFGEPATVGPAKRGHRHVWEPWRSDWRYMRCKKCGNLERSTFGAGVSK